MTFTSYTFLFIFLPIVVIGYFLCNKTGKYFLGKLFLLAASFIFYYPFGLNGFIALLLTIGITYVIAFFGFRSSVPSAFKKLLLALGIVLSISFLAYCKYLLYIESLINKYTGSELMYTALVIPVGISYFTFSEIAYLIDSYKEEQTRYSLLDYSLFISFFPKITVGPIALSKDVIVQFNDPLKKTVNYENLSKGFVRLTLGLSKKLLIADNIGAFVDLAYLNVPNLGTTNALITIIGYTLQIYFDFSGYCDSALGICQMLNLDIVDNFDAPYRALSIVDFWKRWHISLTKFFTNYLYIPLGGSRKGKIRTYINIMIIFLVSGIWHGAATTFIVWGAIHGIGNIISRIISPVTKKLPKLLRWLATFIFVNLTWVFFRSPDLTIAKGMFAQLFSGNFCEVNSLIVATCTPTEGQLFQWLMLRFFPAYTSITGAGIIIFMMLIALILATLCKTASEQVKTMKFTRLRMLGTVILFVWSVLSLSQVSEFIYVNF